MIYTKKLKNLRGRLDDTYIKSHYLVPYSMTSNSRYKHIDELLLYDDKFIKATLSPSDLSIYPYGSWQTFTVTSAEENRIDLVALKFYGSSDLYWIICYVNSIYDPTVLPVGKLLFIPDLSSLRKFPNPLS